MRALVLLTTFTFVAMVALIVETNPTRAADAIDCGAPIARNATAASLGKTFGKANVKTKMVPGAEGIETKATVVTLGKSGQTLTIFWWDEQKLARPANVSLSGGGESWTLAGLSVGMGVKDIEGRNGGPFTISGLGWDYGGAVIDWKDGAFGGKDGCTIMVRFTTRDDIETPQDLSGDGVSFDSNDERFLRLEPTIADVSLGYPAE